MLAIDRNDDNVYYSDTGHDFQRIEKSGIRLLKTITYEREMVYALDSRAILYVANFTYTSLNFSKFKKLKGLY